MKCAQLLCRWGGLALVLIAAGARADGLDAGMWRATSKTEMNGGAAQPAQNMRCLTPADVADLDKTFTAQSRTVNSDCERVEHEFTPQRLKWRLQCRGQVDMDVSGEFRFEARDRYTATVVARMSMAGRLMQMVKTEIEGQWVGECR